MAANSGTYTILSMVNLVPDLLMSLNIDTTSYGLKITVIA